MMVALPAVFASKIWVPPTGLGLGEQPHVEQQHAFNLAERKAPRGKFPRGTTTSSIPEGLVPETTFCLKHAVIGIDHLVKKQGFHRSLIKGLVQGGPRADRHKWSDMSSP